jgi:glycosyltransferase involved in cell wall biosynthesis
MNKLCYITYDCFLDVDFPIIKELNKHLEVYWMVFIKSCREQRFTFREVTEYAEKNNIHFEISEITKRYRSLKHLAVCFSFCRSIKKLNAEIYYFQEFTDPWLPVFSKLFLKNKRIVVSIHDVINHKKDNTLFRRISKTFYTVAFRNYHIFSKNQRDIFKARHPGKNLLLAPLCMKDFGPAIRIRDSGGVNFLFFGAIEYYKGLDFLIEAVNMLARDFKNFKVTIAGYCKDFSPYKKKISDPSCYNLVIRIIKNNEIPGLFINSDYLIQPYRDVTQSGPLKIAFNYHLPVIASDLPGFREDINDGNTGFLFDPDNCMALYRTMISAITRPDNDLAQMRENIRKLAENELNPDKIAGQYLAYFENLSHSD